MTIWTPKDAAGFKTQWHVEDEHQSPGAWRDSDLLVYSTEIKQVRVVHLENVYRYMWHYLTEEGWKHPLKGKHFEDFYAESQDAHGNKEIRWWWRMQKSPGGIAGAHPYFTQKIFIDVLTTGVKRTEMMFNGRKIKPYSGEFILWFNAILVLDQKKWFKEHGILKFLEDFFPRMIYKDRVREQEIELRRIAERTVEDIKHYIGLTRNAEARKPLEEDRQFF